jgi:hypothetical protein
MVRIRVPSRASLDGSGKPAVIHVMEHHLLRSDGKWDREFESRLAAAPNLYLQWTAGLRAQSPAPSRRPAPWVET